MSANARTRQFIALTSEFRRLLYNWIFSRRAFKKLVTNLFFFFFYGSDKVPQAWKQIRWLDVQLLKCPFDLWMYQEIIYERLPDVIIESGTYQGGSALYLASICDLVGQGRVISIDLLPRPNRPPHPRIIFLEGSSTSETTFSEVKAQLAEGDKVMVILDSDHSKAHVSKELYLFSQLVSVGQYLIVEDTCLNGHPILPGYGPGPWEAVHEFLSENPHFIADKSREKLSLTFNPDGYLLRVGT